MGSLMDSMMEFDVELKGCLPHTSDGLKEDGSCRGGGYIGNLAARFKNDICSKETWPFSSGQEIFDDVVDTV
jgi:hypothetical protein